MKGYDYYKFGLVKPKNSFSRFIGTNVSGNRIYSLKINFKNNSIESMYCNCPEGNCKHLAAALYYLDEHPELLKYDENIQKLIENPSKEQLQKFLAEKFINNHDLANKFAEEIYYGLIDSFEILNEYNIFNYTAKTFYIIRIVGLKTSKTKLSFTDSSIILTMLESSIANLVSFNQQIKDFQ